MTVRIRLIPRRRRCRRFRRARSPEVPHAQRRDLRGCGDERLHAIGDRSQGAPADCRGTRRPAAPAVPLSPDLDVVKKAKGPVMTVLDEFYKVGPGPSSSHTIGPMRITYDFYQRCTKLPADQLAKATALKVNLFGSLSATGKGHGTERAALAGLIGKEPATVDPQFLDSLIDKPQSDVPGEARRQDRSTSRLKDVIYDAPKGDFHHPNTMTCKLLAGTTCCWSRSTTPWAAGSSSGKVTRRRRRTRRSTRSRR